MDRAIRAVWWRKRLAGGNQCALHLWETNASHRQQKAPVELILAKQRPFGKRGRSGGGDVIRLPSSVRVHLEVVPRNPATTLKGRTSPQHLFLWRPDPELRRAVGGICKDLTVSRDTGRSTRIIRY